jgi:hypothetical protein
MRGHQEAEGNSSPSDIPSPASAVSSYNDVSEWASVVPQVEFGTKVNIIPL